ncbi:hypothetical protein [Rhabdochromatium marinum]|uniref:hypothetical protein n=1 Tax=Rhabdochromatium marinum TaxID=48729 RepID=UPI001907AAE6|nr:hypothetical protein [Rhabdochromatium marinum]MBK1649577.1 hypothetical protein [Rhabdochromatium marinum]
MGKTPNQLFQRILAFDNLFEAWRKAARGKRSSRAVTSFEDRLADHLLELQAVLAGAVGSQAAMSNSTLQSPSAA